MTTAQSNKTGSTSGAKWIAYSKQTLLNIKKVCRIHRPCPDPLSLFPELRRTHSRKRGRRAGTLVRLRRRAHRAPLPSLLLANVQSLENKLCELRARVFFQPDIRRCNVICLTETWLSAGTPSHAIAPMGFSVHRADRDTELSGKKTGGGVCLMVNRAWCHERNISTVDTVCSPILECLLLQCRPVWLPREFTSVTIAAVYIPPQANKDAALEELHVSISRQETAQPDTALVIAGDFNHAHYTRLMPKLHQHIPFKTRGKNTLDHCYTLFRNGYRALPRPAFGKSDHCSILLLPAYSQRLKREPPVYRDVRRWSDQSEAILQDCFARTDWEAFKSTGNLDDYTNNVTTYIRECTEAIVPVRNIKMMPNQKPWINGDVRAALHTRSVAHKSGSAEDYNNARYALRAAIKQAKKDYSQHTESKLITNNPRHLWQGLQAITDYRGSTQQTQHTSSTFPDDFNSFTARFDPSARPARPPGVFGSSSSPTPISEHPPLQTPPTDIGRVEQTPSGIPPRPHSTSGADQDHPLSIMKVIKKAQQRLYGLRRLKKFGLSPNTIRDFYRGTIESLLTGSFTAWYGSCTDKDRKALRRVVRTAKNITGCELPSLEDLYTQRCLNIARRIIEDPTHPHKRLFSPLKSRRVKGYKILSARTSRLRNSFFPQAIRLLNDSAT
ncbi:hypothetical protein N1851_002802 [Merluccius polli]|uniref:Reverse transcriptase n=1 Tax=Merluccius polli TaxID=89951 RepID=A0AA47N9E9_MERPO|nr:hypothetical protein N1851_002802 [Merluccius polli]